MDHNKNKIFAFFGSDLKGYPDNFLEGLFEDGYEILALDVKAISHASVHNVPFSIINDWLDTESMLEIQDIALCCENNWYNPVHGEFTSNGICWPEFDHFAMKNFWLDTITSIKLAEAFRSNDLEEVLIVQQEYAVPMVFYKGCGILKNLWEKELTAILKGIEPKGSQFIPGPKFALMDKIQEIFRILISLVYSPSANPTGKIAFLASYTELSRSNDLLTDLTKTFPKDIVIISHQISILGAYKVSKKWKVPVIRAPENNYIPKNLVDKFLGAYQNLIKTSNSKVREKILVNLKFHFLHYCQNRWPQLENMFNNYLTLFSKNPPKLIIGAAVNKIEWNLPVLAAKRCGIKTLSIPHGIWSYRPTEDFPLTIQEPLFDYDLYLYPILKEFLNQFSGIKENNLIACKNCTDINSHKTYIIKPEFSENSWKILALFNPATYDYPNAEYPPIFPANKNPKIQMDAIKIFNTPPDDLKEKLSIKFKVHPNYSELELFYAIGDDVLKDVLPTNTQLQPVLEETDLVIGVNYFGSAFFNALKNNKPVILFYSDEFFEKSLKKEGWPFEILGNDIIIARNSDELWNIIRKFFTDTAVSEQIRLNASLFSTQFLDNSNYPTVGNVVEELIQ